MLNLMPRQILSTNHGLVTSFLACVSICYVSIVDNVKIGNIQEDSSDDVSILLVHSPVGGTLINNRASIASNT